MILLDPYVEFITKYKLKQEQFLLLYLLYNDRADLIKTYKKHFPTKAGTMIEPSLIQDLLDRKFLVREGKSVIIGNFFTSIFVSGEVATDEIFSTYPPFMSSNGMDIPLLTMDKKIFQEIYVPKIMGNVAEHKEVLKDIEYGKANNLLNIGINKFVVSEQWKVLRKQRKSHTRTVNPSQDNDF